MPATWILWGLADDLFRWRLDQGKKACANWTREKDSGEPEPTVHTCKECGYIFSQRRVCPECGWKVPFTKRDVAATDADLVPIGRTMHKKLPEGFPTHELFYQMLAHHADCLKYAPAWAKMQYMEKCGQYPPPHWSHLALIPPTKRVKNWIHSRRIAYAKARAKANQAA